MRYTPPKRETSLPDLQETARQVNARKAEFDRWTSAYLVTLPLSVVTLNTTSSPVLEAVTALAIAGVCLTWVYMMVRLRRAEKLHRAAWDV